jgi:hypothetical protein
MMLMEWKSTVPEKGYFASRILGLDRLGLFGRTIIDSLKPISISSRDFILLEMVVDGTIATIFGLPAE